MVAATSKLAAASVPESQGKRVLEAIKIHANKRSRAKTAAELAFLMNDPHIDSHAVNRRTSELVNEKLIKSSGTIKLGKVCSVKSRQKGRNIMCMYFYWKD